jgi:sugar lactone lactonase YvrE
LYRLDTDGTITTPLPGITLSNGLDWDVARQRMYFIDSVEQRIDVYDYDVDTGEIEGGRPFATIDAADGLPDGLTLDADGCVWVALFEGGVIRGYDPSGAVIREIDLPTTCPTCPTFGGSDLSTMFVTTSRHKLDAAQRAVQPLAGAILVVDPGVRGRPANHVGGGAAAALRTEG